jgi:glycosyltransferase involved in cell wall biosynthesis
MGLSTGPNGRGRLVVYTCMFGYSEHFNDFAYHPDGVDFVCFTDDPELRSDFWSMRLVKPGLLDPARAAKQVKTLAHRFLPEYDCSLYIDNTVRLKAEPKRLFDELLARTSAPFVCFRHYSRDCVYDEADQVIALGYDDPERVRAQMRSYRSIGYPAKNGLAALPFILRRHLDPELVPVMEQWLQHILQYSLRDQLSFNPVAWLHRLTVGYIDLEFADYQLFDWPIVKKGVRIPRDFDDARYLKLHPDVTINPRRHYLFHGAAEGRRYKEQRPRGPMTPHSVAWLSGAPVTRDPRGGLTAVAASARYRCLIPHRELTGLGVQSVIHFSTWDDTDLERSAQFVQKFDVEIVVAGKLNHPSIVDYAALTRTRGCFLVADFCDDDFDDPALGPRYRRLADMADQVVAGTPQMANVIATETGRAAIIIPDPYEGPRREPKFAPSEGHLKVLWFGNVTSLDGLDAVLPELISLSQKHPLRLTVVTDETRITVDVGVGWPASFELLVVPWSVDRVWDEIANCDLVIIPSLQTRKKSVKGANRLIEAIWGGRAVVAHPLPAYEEFHDFCRLDESIARGIVFTLQNRDLVSARIAAGQAWISERYAPAVVAKQWKECFAQLRLGLRPVKAETHLPNPIGHLDAKH